MVQELKTLQEVHNALSLPGNMVIDFGATWCGPCRVVAPKFQALSLEYPDVRFYKLDIDQVDISELVEIQGVPTFLFLRNGNMVTGFAGANVARIQQELDNLRSLELEKVPNLVEN